jgi:hypothetical protein
MPNRSPKQIAQLVEEHKRVTTSLRQRMDNDYSIYRLDEYVGETDNTGVDPLAGFRKYTSNEPRTFANKVLSLLTSARLIIRAERGDKTREERSQSNDKERFVIGMLNAVDERLLRLMLPKLDAQLAFHCGIRGRYAVRSLLTKREDGSTIPDVTPFDPRHVYWAMGRDGLAWVIHEIQKTPQEIQAQYGVTIEPKAPNGAGPSREQTETVFDYYDGEVNKVVTEDRVLKRATKHGSPRTPIVLGIVGPTPPIQNFESSEGSSVDTSEDYGESIYQADRRGYKELNFALSAMSEFVKRSLKQPYVLTSKDGSKTLMDNPYLSGTEIPLREGEKIEPLNLLTMAQETGVWMGLITGEIQRGALPHSAFGELQFQLSGFAINSLRQGMTTAIEPPRQAMEDAYQQITELLSDQYATGAFKSFEVSGRDRERNYFSEEITPEVVKNGGELEIELVANLPQDDVQAIATAVQMREGPIPLADDRYIREHILKIPDSDLMNDAVLEQMAGRASPVAAAFQMMMAAAEQGDMQLAQIWLGELTVQLKQQFLNLAQLTLAAQGLGAAPTMNGAAAPTMNGAAVPGGNGAGPRRFAPGQVPNSAQGVPPPTPVPQMGPLVPPGSPRGAAQSDETRLAALGLTGPRG